MAQYYGIVNMEAVPLRRLAVLFCGLPPQSRSMMQLSGEKLTLEQMLLASVSDGVSTLAWLSSADGAKGKNRPKLILSELNKDDSEKPMSFAGGAAFDAAWKQLTEGGTNT